MKYKLTIICIVFFICSCASTQDFQMHDTKLAFPEGKIYHWNVQYNAINAMQCISWRSEWQYGFTCYTPKNLRGLTPIEKLHKSMFKYWEKIKPENTPETPYNQLKEKEKT